jgi:hypothetical protein
MLKWDRATTKRNLGWIKRDDGTPFKSVDEFREVLLNELEQGHRVLPTSSECIGFDFKTGCPGHETEDDNATANV